LDALEIAKILFNLPANDRPSCFCLLIRQRAVEVFAYFPAQVTQLLLALFPADELKPERPLLRLGYPKEKSLAF
jgi:hypothetical protein